MRNKPNENAFHVFVIVMLAGWFFMTGCEQEDPGDTENGCVSCHLDKDKLQEVADPIEYEEDSGEG